MLSTTSCRANVNYREKMATAMDEEERKLQRLKAAVHYTVGRLCQSIGEDHQKEFSRQVIAAIAETTFRQCDIFAKDLEAFARHAKRSTVSVEDVKLTARRSTALSNFIQRKSEEIASANQEQRDTRKKIAGKRKNTEMV
ncbi:centromere protein S [Oncorhynchus nerka]|uniref:centromere protein S n=1 Tax=Oncorhynchus nerka TaxID=8023 RepID=UPI00113169FE|nr:centromere protein S-like [Oncorhynchus nerka]